MERDLSDDEIKGRCKQFAQLVRQRPEFFLTTLNDFLVDCDVGCNPYYKNVSVSERRKEPCLTLTS